MAPVAADFRLDGDERLRRVLRRLRRPDADPALRRGLDRGSVRLQDSAKRAASGPVLNRRTGAGINSIIRDTSRSPDVVRIGSTLPYMAAHQQAPSGGLVIRPVRARVLTIPLPAALTAKGVQRFSAPQASRVYEATFWRMSGSGNLILWGVRGGRLTPLFLGRKRVVLPPRRWLTAGFDEALPRVGDDIIRAWERFL